MLRSSICLLLGCLLTASPLSADEPAPLRQAHAHNDYHHPRPLLDALSHGFCSVEADVYLVDDQLLVAHDRKDLTPERTLEGLYLKPLRQRIQQNRGRVYSDGPPFTLLIDIKSRGAATWEALDELLAGYADILTQTDGDVVTPGAVTAIVSGNRAFTLIEETSPRFAAIDGRLHDLKREPASSLVPLISDNWRRHFRWNGQGDVPVEDREKLTQLVRTTHEQNRRLRLWATPDTPAAWQLLHESGVDLINTDDLAGLSSFLKQVVE